MAKVQKMAGIRGMNDIRPSEAPIWEYFEECAHDVLRGYGYKQIRTPILEATSLFKRGIGEVTDIVEKEMYCFTDSLNGEELALRPETRPVWSEALLSITLPITLLSVCGISDRCSVTNVPNAVVTASSIS